MNAPHQLYTKAVWRDWFERSMLLSLETNLQNVQSTIGPVQNFLRSCEQDSDANTQKHWKKVRRQFQATVYAKLHTAAAPNAQDRFRHKLARWKLDDPNQPAFTYLSVTQRTPNWQARSAQQRLRQLAGLVAPRVHAAVFGSIWNRWCTRRRFQLRGTCRLCQAVHSEDSIEHYAFCKVVRELAARRLRLDAFLHVNLHTFTCTNPLLNSKELLTRAALLIYATYRALNYQRHAASPLLGEDLFHAMSQWVVEGARGNAQSCQVLAKTWSQNSDSLLPGIQ